jgi:spectinomycin phosphotransferase
MLVKPPLSDQRIIDCLNTNYGIEVITLTFLPLGADMNAWVYKAEKRNRSSYFVKLKRGHHHDIGIAVVEILHKAGIQQIIPPIKTIDNQPVQCIDDFTLIVYPFIEGQNGFSCPLTDEQWLILGKTLRQIHEIDVPLSIQHQIRREAYSPKWREIVRLLYAHIEAEPIGNEIALKLLVFMKEHILAIRQLVDRSEQLAQILQNESPKFVLCHSDIHGGNVLMDDNNTIFIVDWDDPIMAPKERDLMFIGGGVANVWNKRHEEALFYMGYGKTDVNKAILAYYRHERIVEDIAEYGQNLLLTVAGGEDRAEMYKHFIAMFEPNGVVDIAFKTDEDFAV